MSVRGETTIYSIAMGDVLLERKFIYLLYGISHVNLKTNATQTVTAHVFFVIFLNCFTMGHKGLAHQFCPTLPHWHSQYSHSSSLYL